MLGIGPHFYCKFRTQVWSVLRAARWKYRTQKWRKNRHLRTFAQICWVISSQLRHVSTIGKKLVSTNMSSRCSHNMVNFGPRAADICCLLTSLGHPCKFQRVSRLGSITARHLVVGVSQTLRRWTEGRLLYFHAVSSSFFFNFFSSPNLSYVRQGDHHVGHWPTF